MTKARREPGPDRLPRNKVALLHVAKRDLALTEEDYRAILLRFGNAGSTAELDLLGFEAVIAHLTQLGFRSSWQKRTFGNRPGMASPAQVDLIRQLWREYHGDHQGDAALQAWLNRFHHVSALRFVDAQLAGRIIPGLKAMAARKKAGPQG